MIAKDNVTIRELDLSPSGCKVVLVSPRSGACSNLQSWLEKNSDFVESLSLSNPVLLFRGFDVNSVGQYSDVVDCFVTSKIDYLNGSTPRSSLGNGIYTTTEYPKSHSIPLHIESSYSKSWPMRLVLHCIKPADVGGETPLASSRGITDRIPEEIKDEFRRKGVLYVRNYRRSIGVPWQQAFQTDSRNKFERLCKENQINFEWLGDDWVRTTERRHAFAKHPCTKEMLWCNQALLFHISNLSPDIRNHLTSSFREMELPRNSFFGDGTSIPDSVIESIRSAHKEEEFSIPWEKGDVMCVDNMLVHHARNPFEGSRRVLISMGIKFEGEVVPDF